MRMVKKIVLFIVSGLLLTVSFSSCAAGSAASRHNGKFTGNTREF